MSDHFYHRQVRLKNFTVFTDAAFDFAPGVNAIIGENGTGKTHLLKALYAVQRTQARPNLDMQHTLAALFQTRKLIELIRLGSGKTAIMDISGRYGNFDWSYAVQRAFPETLVTQDAQFPAERPIFIPAIDMIGHTKGFVQASSEVVLDFDLTCLDIVNLLGLRHQNGDKPPITVDRIDKMLGGSIEYDENSDRFYLVNAQGRIPMPLVAEGLRKIATLARLVENGWITAGTTLFWDEPEGNINPVLMDELVGILLSLARQGVQVILGTHSYVILKELDLQATDEDGVRFFSLSRAKSGTRVMSADTFTALQPNPILQHYASIYDRDISRAAGRKPHSAKMR